MKEEAEVKEETVEEERPGRPNVRRKRRRRINEKAEVNGMKEMKKEEVEERGGGGKEKRRQRWRWK